MSINAVLLNTIFLIGIFLYDIQKYANNYESRCSLKFINAIKNKNKY